MSGYTAIIDIEDSHFQIYKYGLTARIFWKLYCVLKELINVFSYSNRSLRLYLTKFQQNDSILK